MSIKPAPDVTVILLSHDEGRLANRGVRSALRMIEVARANGLIVEFLAVLSDPSEDTSTYFGRHSDWFDEVHAVREGSLGAARNEAAKQARGEFLAYLDCGDVWSENWLSAAVQVARRSKPAIFHPACTLNFGSGHHLTWHVAFTDIGLSARDLVQSNLWPNTCVVARQTMLEIPQTEIGAETGFAYEDWHWNCETLHKSIEHLVVPETVRFARVEDLGTPPARRRGLIPKTDLFNLQTMCKRPTDLPDVEPLREPLPEPPAAGPKTPGFAFRAIRWVYRRTLKRLIAKPAPASAMPSSSADAISGTATPALAEGPVPEWLLRHWRAQNRFEPELFPTRDLAAVSEYRVPRSTIADVYARILKVWPEDTTHVCFVPWLKRGGADLVAIHYMNTLVERGFGKGILCIMTEPDSDSPWVSRLADGIVTFNLGIEGKELTDEEKSLLVATLLVQQRPHAVHNVNSRIAYEAFGEFGKAISQHSNLYTNVFCLDMAPDGTQLGWPVEYLDPCYDVLSAVFSENENIVDVLCELYDFDRSRFVTNYSPVDFIPKAPKDRVRKRRAGDPLQVLWAGRIDWQKAPDVLAEVARRCQGLDITFHVYGSIWRVAPEVLSSLEGATNTILHGPFEGFNSIPSDDMDVFLHTALWEGIPIVLLEAVMSGLPCIAPPVGGIPELLTKERGFLVGSSVDVDGYVKKLTALFHNPNMFDTALLETQALVLQRHSHGAFASRIASTQGYIAG